MNFYFNLVEFVPESGKYSAFLQVDNWNDFSFRTLFVLYIFDEKGKRHTIGEVKIGEIGQTRDNRTQIPDSFETLGSTFFSLGQDYKYYENLQDVDDNLKAKVLDGLNDIANNGPLLEKVISEEVTQVSLLRSINRDTIKGQYKRILEGGAPLTEYIFEYTAAQQIFHGLSLDFYVEPNTNPPTNIHVLIGRNGVGKTRLLNSMVRALTKLETSERNGNFVSIAEGTMKQDKYIFDGIVSIAYSAFDPFEPFLGDTNRDAIVEYTYVGLKTLLDKSPNASPADPYALSEAFIESLSTCLSSGKRSRWIRAITDLQSDHIFSDLGILELANYNTVNDLKTGAEELLGTMSSGHRIVLLTITKLVEKVEERTLVMFDEPESHLHPPLLAAFIRSLSNLLTNRNGVAIIATHSPVIAQEVPKSCVWNFRRVGEDIVSTRPSRETFGENLGVLTHEIFNLEVLESGHFKLISDAVDEFKSYEDVLNHFAGQLGSEAKAIARGLISQRREKRSTE